MNEVLNAIRTRRSVRKFRPDPVPAELLDQILEAGTWAASGRGRQPVIILAVTDQETRDMLSRWNAGILGSTADPFFGAPVVLVVLAQKDISTHVYDGSLVMGNLMLAAHSLGLGSCWIHRAKEEFETPEGKALLEKLGVEGEYEGIGHCILGWPDGDAPAPKPRKENWIYRI